MNLIQPTRPRQRLDPQVYERLREQVLHRDSWRCQSCGSRTNLEVHHKEFRSQGGNDSEENLITLCVVCHSLAHRDRSAPEEEGDTAMASDAFLSQERSVSESTKRCKLGLPNHWVDWAWQDPAGV
jgi:hypothetical protein